MPGLAVLGLAVLQGGCATYTSVAQRTSPVVERRIRLRPNAPLLTARWQVEPHAIQGELSWTRCQSERSWTTSKVRTTKQESSRELGWTFFGIATAGFVTSSVTRDYDFKKTCDLYGCSAKAPDNTGSNVLFVGSLAASVAGAVVFLTRSRVSEEVLESKEHRRSETAACVPTRDLDELVLVLKVGRGSVWPVRLDKEGNARVLVPEGAEVPRDRDLLLTVYRAPKAAADLPLKAGQVLDTLRLDSPTDAVDEADAPPPTPRIEDNP